MYNRDIFDANIFAGCINIVMTEINITNISFDFPDFSFVFQSLNLETKNRGRALWTWIKPGKKGGCGCCGYQPYHCKKNANPFYKIYKFIYVDLPIFIFLIIPPLLLVAVLINPLLLSQVSLLFMQVGQVLSTLGSIFTTAFGRSFKGN